MFEEEETLCWDHIDDANTRARWIFGIPFVILVIASVICCIFSVIGIVNAMGDVDFEAGLEAVPDTVTTEIITADITNSSL